MLGRRESRPALALAAFGALLLAALPAGAGAGATSRPGILRGQQADLAGRTRAAVLGLYALDARLAETRTELASVQARAADVERERARVRHEVAVARRVLVRSQRQLADRLRMLYEEGEPDAIAVLLGSTSLQDAISRLDELQRTAHLDRQAIEQSSTARTRLAALAARLAVRAGELRRLEAAATQAAAALAAARAERISYIARLRREQRLAAAELAQVNATARLGAQRSLAIAARPGAAAELAAAPPRDASITPASAHPRATTARTITVTATGYSMDGTTSTGLPAGWGVVAVDPGVIPLGTRLSIPGYGDGVAADIGPAVQGAAIDVWFPTPAEAMGWGRRVLTITLH